MTWPKRFAKVGALQAEVKERARTVAGRNKPPFFTEWDYLVITASSEKQAEAYRSMIDVRKSLGLFNRVKNVLVVADPDGRRVGSGGSTIHCLLHILKLELMAKRNIRGRLDRKTWAEVLNQLRVLVAHAGGDSRRLPPYGPCGKIFAPVPGGPCGALGTTLFDRLIPAYLKLPRPSIGRGQVVVASGDVFLDFDAEEVVFAENGITGVGAFVNPNVAKNHGVYCRQEDGIVRMFLQKPSVARQVELGAVNPYGQSVLDIGILNFDAAAAVRLIELCGIRTGREDKPELAWKGPLVEVIERKGLDIYREICCALGKDVRNSDYLNEVKGAGSGIDDLALRSIYHGLRAIPFHVHVVPRLRFFHFGTLQDLIKSGMTLINAEIRDTGKDKIVVVNSRVCGQGSISGKNAWVEGCRIEAPLALAGDNVVVGLDIATPFALPRGGCLDVIKGEGRDGRQGWYLRAYSMDDKFHVGPEKGARLCGLPVLKWLEAIGASPTDVWGARLLAEERTVWNGRFFPIIRENCAHQKWIWLLDPGNARACQKEDWLTTDRYSLEEIALRADLDYFHSRRTKIRGDILKESLSRAFSLECELSAAEIAFLIQNEGKDGRKDWILALVRQAIRSYGTARTHHGLGSLEFSRILHTLGSVLLRIASGGDSGKNCSARVVAEVLEAGLAATEKIRVNEMGLPIAGRTIKAWAGKLKEEAFQHVGRTIVYRRGGIPAPPRAVLRSDEIVWGRAPARLDLGGGWTDTPPYSLERGGSVINAAVNLNGQAPIQAYARVIEKREIRINSIDHSTREVVRSLEELLDYRKPGSQFALAKAALALAGFAPEAARWPAGARTLEGMLRYFGGGIELTTLAAIPSGSGLGTSSIMGAVLLSTICKVVGRPLTRRDLFYAVLKLEQELTTGGGWQDQIGGAVEGVKMITAEKGLVPDPRIHFVPADLLDPVANGGRTLLYYTGLRRLAKNILHDVVGRYLDRERGAMETLRRLHAFPPLMAEAMSTRDAEQFGGLIDIAWKLNVDLDPNHTNPIIEELRARIRPHILGAKLLGAGGGGFLLIICKSPTDAAALKRKLQKKPPNDKARFFDYSISKNGLSVTVC